MREIYGNRNIILPEKPVFHFYFEDTVVTLLVLLEEAINNFFILKS